MDDLRQVFNRGGLGTGHLNKEVNHDLVYKEKQNNMGIYIGNVANYNVKKGHITLNLNDRLELGDSITFENEGTKYKVSELMFQGNNIPFACHNELITIGRMKGNIKPGDKIFKIANKRLTEETKLTYSGKELKKIKLNCTITIKEDKPIVVSITPYKEYEAYKNISLNMESEIIPEKALNKPITEEKIITQFSKTNDTPYEFSKIEVILDDGLYIAKISEINELRRKALERLEALIAIRYTRVPVEVKEKKLEDKVHLNKTKISMLLFNIKPEFDYSRNR